MLELDLSPAADSRSTLPAHIAGSSSDDDFDPEPEAGEDDGTGVPGEPKQPRNLRRWAGEDDENLKTAYEKHGWDWDKIAEDVGHGRTARACKERWTKTLKPHDPDDDVEPEEPVSDDGDYEIDSDIDAEGGECAPRAAACGRLRADCFDSWTRRGC